MNLVWWFRYLDTHARCWVKTSPHVMIVGAAKDMMQDHPRDSKPELNQTLPHVARPLRLATGAGCAKKAATSYSTPAGDATI